MIRYIKLFDSLYALHFQKQDEKIIKLGLATRPTVQEFQEFCFAFNVGFELEYISKYCQHSDIMHDAVFNS